MQIYGGRQTRVLVGSREGHSWAILSTQAHLHGPDPSSQKPSEAQIKPQVWGTNILSQHYRQKGSMGSGSLPCVVSVG